MRATRKALPRSRGFDRVAVGGPDKFRLLVSPSAGERACAILDRLVAAIEDCGWKAHSTDKGFAILADEEAVGFMIEEKLEEVAHAVTARELKEQAEYERKCALADRGIGHRPWRAPLIPKFDFVPAGELALKLDQNYAAEGIRRTFADGKKQRLDNLIPSILASIERYAAAVKARREQQKSNHGGGLSRSANARMSSAKRASRATASLSCAARSSANGRSMGSPTSSRIGILAQAQIQNSAIC